MNVEFQFEQQNRYGKVYRVMTHESDGSPWYVGKIECGTCDPVYKYIHEPEGGLSDRLLDADAMLRIGGFLIWLNGRQEAASAAGDLAWKQQKEGADA